VTHWTSIFAVAFKELILVDKTRCVNEMLIACTAAMEL
jgi:hypothetical protein